jgi:hypothetical protein
MILAIKEHNAALILLCNRQEISALPFWRDQLDAMAKFGMKAEIEGEQQILNPSIDINYPTRFSTCRNNRGLLLHEI